MEASAGAHYWGREIPALGHEVKLVPPIYVKPFVKRGKNDVADAEAITEAAQRPTMHFVPVKTEAQQAQGMLFRTRDLLVRQRTQTINALRGHLAEYGVVAPQAGPGSGSWRRRSTAGVVELLCGLLLMAGWKPAWAAGGLLLFLLPVTALLENPLAGSADFGTLIDFLKNLAIMGGLLMVVLWERRRDAD